MCRNKARIVRAAKWLLVATPMLIVFALFVVVEVL